MHIERYRTSRYFAVYDDQGALIVVTWPKVKQGLGFPARAFAILP